MDPYTKDQLLSFYNAHYRKFGERPEALRWTPQGQLRRYHTFLEIAPSLQNQKILDYGCGMADFYKFLKRRGIAVDYTGVDINENFIAVARKNYPECSFRVMNTDDDVLEGAYDYIFICGVFNLQVPGVDDDLKNCLATLFRHCKKGMALSALSAHTPIRDPELHFTSPEDLLQFAIEHLSPSVALRHDRIEHDFTLYVYTSYNKITL